MNVSIIFEDKTITIDGKGLIFTTDYATYFDAVVNNEGHGTVHAIQWNSETAEGELEVIGESNINITADIVQPYIDLYNEQKERLKTEQLNMFTADQFARFQRNELLIETDWWAVSDRTMTAEETAYRQALRDLPTDSANWNPVLSWDETNESVVCTGVNFPTKPE